MSVRKYDLVLFGATGYTGKLCARHLQGTYSKAKKDDVRWAIAGRSEKRLQMLKASLKLDCDIVIADSGDQSSLDSMTRDTKCVANLVGPYLRLGGMQVVESCVRQGTCYVDLTGESEFYSQVIDKYHEKAKETGAIIVPSAGFDSVPGDLTAYLASEYLCKDNPNDEVVDAWVGIRTFGWFSSGTMESLIVMAEGKNGDMIRSTRADWLSPIKDAKLKNDFSLWRYHAAFRQFGAWLFFAPHNTRVMYRTWGLVTQSIQEKDGKKEGRVRFSRAYKYQEAIIVPIWLFTVATSILIKLLTLLFVYSPITRRVLSAVLPRNGGPPEFINTTVGFMDTRTIVTMKSGRTALGKLASRGDPGYQLTSKMLIETGLTLAKTEKERLNPLVKNGGVFTPALAGGQNLANRLSKFGGFTVQVTKL